MGFFEELPDPPAPERQPPPAWSGSPGNELPVAVPLQLLAGRSDVAAVLLGGARVFSAGVELDLTMLIRDEPDRFGYHDPLHLHHGQDKAGVLRLAVRCADGSQAEAARSFPLDGSGEVRRVFTTEGGGGGQGRWTYRMWLWPLPPPGAVEVFCAWPVHGIDETRTSFDAAPLLEAAGRVERLWPENADPGGGSSWTTFVEMTPRPDDELPSDP